MVGGEPQVIVAIGVSNQASDAVHLLPMIERIKVYPSQQPDALIADIGDCSMTYQEACQGKHLIAYLLTRRQQQGHRPWPQGLTASDLDAAPGWAARFDW